MPKIINEEKITPLTADQLNSMRGKNPRSDPNTNISEQGKKTPSSTEPPVEGDYRSEKQGKN